MNKDPYVYPDTNVLINKLGITEEKGLEEAERGFYIKKANEPLPTGNLDYAHLKSIHKHFFGGLYAWAGEERTIDISKNDSFFARKEFLAKEIKKIFSKLKINNNLKDLDKEDFVKHASFYFNELNAAHPFRDGNGRVLRNFFDLLASQAGYRLDWLKVDREEYIQANIQGFNGNYAAMESIFKKIIATANNAFKS